jgi:hypothetical protein
VTTRARLRTRPAPALAGPRALLSLALLLLAAACGTPRLEWRDLELGERDFEQVWTVFDAVSRQTGHPPATETDRGLRVYVSRWRERALGFGRTRRTRVRGEFDRDEGSRAWNLRYLVEAQRVDDMARSLEPGPDDWEAAGQDAELEQRIDAQMRYRLGLTRLTQ